jgi:predicted nucleotidyltransferase
MNPRQRLNCVEDLQALLKQQKLLQQFALSRLGVFGSFARLEQVVDNRLDVMLKKWANPIVLHRAMKDMRYVEG